MSVLSESEALPEVSTRRLSKLRRSSPGYVATALLESPVQGIVATNSPGKIVRSCQSARRGPVRLFAI